VVGALSKRTTRPWRPESGRRIYQRFLRFKGLAFSSTAGTFFGHPFYPVACKKATRVLRLTVKITCRFLNTRDRTIRIVPFVSDKLSPTISFKRTTICPLLALIYCIYCIYPVIYVWLVQWCLIIISSYLNTLYANTFLTTPFSTTILLENCIYIFFRGWKIVCLQYFFCQEYFYM